MEKNLKDLEAASSALCVRTTSDLPTWKLGKLATVKKGKEAKIAASYYYMLLILLGPRT
jgi:hypothetical protein